MKVLVDMNLSPNWARFLAEAGLDAVHWTDVGPGNAPDTEVLRWAAEHGHVVLTADLGFGAILASTQSVRPSVVQVRDEVLTTRAIGSSVLAAMRQAREELIKGALVSVDAARARMRILPLGE